MQSTAGTFVDRLRDKQRLLGLNQSALAARLGVHKSAVSLVLRGRRGYSLEFARAVIAQWPEFAAYAATDLGLTPEPGAAEVGHHKETA